MVAFAWYDKTMLSTCDRDMVFWTRDLGTSSAFVLTSSPTIPVISIFVRLASSAKL